MRLAQTGCPVRQSLLPRWRDVTSKLLADWLEYRFELRFLVVIHLCQSGREDDHLLAIHLEGQRRFAILWTRTSDWVRRIGLASGELGHNRLHAPQAPIL